MAGLLIKFDKKIFSVTDLGNFMSFFFQVFLTDQIPNQIPNQISVLATLIKFRWQQLS